MIKRTTQIISALALSLMISAPAIAAEAVDLDGRREGCGRESCQY